MTITKATDPKKEAEVVLEAYWPQRTVPVDPVVIARLMGVIVREWDLPEKVSGALLKKTGADPVILLEQGDHPNRKRFTCAHELGHFVRRAGSDQITFVDLRGPIASQGIDEEEIFANQFAANLLMPEDQVRTEVARYGRVFLVANIFGVSAEAMKFRITNLGLQCND